MGKTFSSGIACPSFPPLLCLEGPISGCNHVSDPEVFRERNLALASDPGCGVVWAEIQRQQNKLFFLRFGSNVSQTAQEK